MLGYFAEQPNARHIRINADSKRLRELAFQIQKKSVDFKRAENIVAGYIAKNALEYLKYATPRWTGRLRRSTTCRNNGNTFHITQESAYAKYVEYGTGQKGAAVPHPEKPDGWVYMSGPTQRFIPFLGIVWKAPIRGFWRWTGGQVASKQVYRTRKFIRDNRTALAREVVGKILKKGM